MHAANRKQTVGSDFVHGTRVAPTCACRLVAVWPRRPNCRRQAHNRKIPSAVLRGVRSTTLAVPRRAAVDMSTQHVVGESVVVPGLKLTDHTFQVRCSHSLDDVREDVTIAGSLAVRASTPSAVALVFQVDTCNRYPWIITTSKATPSTCLCGK